jgi:hypothetical protein
MEPVQAVACKRIFGAHHFALVSALEQLRTAFVDLGATAHFIRTIGMSSQRDTETPAPREWSERETVHSPVVPAEQARDAATGHGARYVLGFSLAAIILVFLVIYLVYFA